MKKQLHFFLIGLFLGISAITQAGTSIPFTFSLSVGAKTSAGVFTTDSVLVRTLWSNVFYAAGTYTKAWDGKDDNGVLVADTVAGSYHIKVLSNNISYNWEGIVGNTSAVDTGGSVHQGYSSGILGMAIANNTAYYCTGYSEGRASSAKFLLSNIQARINIFPDKLTQNTNFVATDGTNVYWGGFDSYSANNAFVYATKVSNDAEVSFSGGSAYTVTYGKSYISAIDLINASSSNISGLAVQRSGGYLFVAHAGLNQLHVLNKTTGALVQTLSYTSPGALCIDGNDNLWMVSNTNTVNKYSVNTNGTLSSTPILSLSGLVSPTAIQVSPNNNTVLVADAGSSQQVKAFSNSSGSPSWTKGTFGGYAVDATVSDNKFYFSDVVGNQQTFIVFQSDNSFWVGDPGNFRAQHYDASQNFLNRIMFLGSSYFTWIDKNNITRLFAGFLEFSIDYSQPISTSWILVKNWGANVPSTYDLFQKIRYPTTLSNGRTYGLLNSQSGYEAVEFPSTGQLRFTGVHANGIICKDGSLQSVGTVNIGQPAAMSSYSLTGFTGSNNPIWNSTPTTLASIASVGLTDPIPPEDIHNETISSSNKIIFYNYSSVQSYGNPNVLYTGYHLGAIQKGTNKWLWKTELATHADYGGAFPDPGYFDIGNTVNDYAGSIASVIDRTIITGYHGEFWKQSQTNKYNHYYDDGLALGQFGITRPETVMDANAMMAGNALTPMLVKDTSGNLYLWHGDESDHSGIHKWKITGLNTIAEQIIPVHYPSTYTTPTPCYTDLMVGLPYDTVLTNGTNGWNRNPASQISGAWNVQTGNTTYDRSGSQPEDVYIEFTSNNSTYSVTRDLGINNVTNSWKLTGQVSYPGTMPNIVGSGTAQAYFDILDASGKIISRFYNTINYSNNPIVVSIYGNTQLVTQDTGPTLQYRIMQTLQNLEISAASGVITFSYAGFPAVTASVYDPSANWATPKTIRFYFIGASPTYPAYGSIIDVNGLRFYKDVIPPTVPVISASGPTNFCQGGQVVLSTGSSYPSYQWSNGATTPSINVTNSGTYSVMVSNTCGMTASSGTSSVTVKTKPIVSVSSTTICSGNSASLVATGATNYTWNTSATTATISVSPVTTTNYTVIGTTANGCADTGIALVTVNATPTVSLILSATSICTSSGSVLLTGTPSGGVFSGTGVSGNSFYPAVSGAGTFTVTYTYSDANSCANEDQKTIAVNICTGINGTSDNLFAVYPNPATENFTVNFNLNTDKIDIEVFDATGKLVLIKKDVPNHAIIPIEHLASGIYHVKLKSGNIYSEIPIIKQ